MILPEAPWQRRSGMADLLAAIGAAEGESRYVGGCVRDTLLDAAVSDVDIATRLDPQEVLDRLAKAQIRAVPTGLAHGTITAVVHGSPVEVTTLRRDVATDGRRATIAYTGDWREDAARRDFTINALSADPATREIYDYFDGLSDLRAGRVRFIGDPMRRIAEDHLRILRFFRFHARFGSSEPDAEALEACSTRANDLMALSRERIADELLKLLALPRAADAMALMQASGILAPVLPEIDEEAVHRLARLVGREGTCRVAADPLRRLAALLPPDPELVRAVAARLRLSNKAMRRLEIAAARGEPVPGDPRIMAYRIGGEETIDRLLLGDEPNEDLADKVRALEGWERPRLQIGGGDLIAMGLQPGPVVSRVMQAVERDWAEGGFSNDPEELRRLARRHVDQLLRSSQ